MEKYKFVFSSLDEYDTPRYQYIMKSLTQINSDDLKGINNAISFLMEKLESHYH